MSLTPAPALLCLAGLAGATPGTRADLVDVREVVPDVVLDLRYATANNFVGERLYDAARCMLRREVAERLGQAAATLRARGYRLVAWDCYRPRSVQQRMWKRFPRRGYVAPPMPGSVHNRAAAVDVTLADAAGRALRMPTDFDAFGPAANLGSRAHPLDVLTRRAHLRAAMLGAGFVGIRSEWWHFEAREGRRYPVLDVPMQEQAASTSAAP